MNNLTILNANYYYISKTYFNKLYHNYYTILWLIEYLCRQAQTRSSPTGLILTLYPNDPAPDYLTEGIVIISE